MLDPTDSTADLADRNLSVSVAGTHEVSYADLGICGSVALAHWKPGTGGEPVICVLPHDECGKMSALELAFMLNESLSLTVEAPDSSTRRGAPGPHPRIDLHLNPDPTYGHGSCVIVDACGVCTSDLFDPLLTYGHGTISRHLTEAEMSVVDTYGTDSAPVLALMSGTVSGNTLSRPFRLVRPDEAIEALQVVASRFRPDGDNE